MGKIVIKAQGSNADMQRLYEHLAGFYRKISDTRTESYENHKKTQEFWVEI